MAQMHRHNSRSFNVYQGGWNSIDKLNEQDKWLPRENYTLSIDGFSPRFSNIIDELDHNRRNSKPHVVIEDSIFYPSETTNSTRLVRFPEVRPAPPPTRGRIADQERFTLMARSPIGASAYGVATLLGADRDTADTALHVGAVADSISVGGLRLGGRTRQIAPAPRQGLAHPTQRQPATRMGGLNERNQSSYAQVTATNDVVGTGTKARRSLKPPGWQEAGPGTPPNQVRGHLIARVLGGTGRDLRNLVTISSRVNQQMWDFERIILARTRKGEVVYYHVQPIYSKHGTAPTAIVMTATGSREGTVTRIIIID